MTQLIERDNKHYIECSIELVETDKAENAFYKQGNKLFYHRGYLTQDYIKNSLGAKSYHIYFLAYQQLFPGDWYRNSIGNFCRLGEEAWEIEHVRKENYPKVISTTDSSLTFTKHDIILGEKDSYEVELPYPTRDFIRVYTEKFNQDRQIKKVLLEVNLLCCQTGISCGFPCNGDCTKNAVPSLVTNNNEVIVKKLNNNTYSDEDVAAIVFKALRECDSFRDIEQEMCGMTDVTEKHFTERTQRWIDINL